MSSIFYTSGLNLNISVLFDKLKNHHNPIIHVLDLIKVIKRRRKDSKVCRPLKVSGCLLYQQKICGIDA
ncbi:hypothetical protein EUGRSUZ_C02296 [Eucalyptus grandis]|uniref:Uncharacterized protein n=2 Tax=Eucalyptus grandis TaxID=71139 RepID=A0ACC3LFC2_EUCGR|nr:hypothetical protein EUGRSUZ_C02296 [Eucalyptus grandis]